MAVILARSSSRTVGLVETVTRCNEPLAASCGAFCGKIKNGLLTPYMPTLLLYFSIGTSVTCLEMVPVGSLNRPCPGISATRLPFLSFIQTTTQNTRLVLA